MLSNVTFEQVRNYVQSRMIEVRNGMGAANQAHGFTQGISVQQLAALPDCPGSADAQALMDAVNDSYALFTLYDTGLLPANTSYPVTIQNPAAPFVFGASQRRAIGPQ